MDRPAVFPFVKQLLGCTADPAAFDPHQLAALDLCLFHVP
jgi:hypothetical protein